MISFLDLTKQLEEAKATYTIKDSEGNIKHAGTDKDIAYKTHKSLNAKEPGHKLYKNGVSCLTEVLSNEEMIKEDHYVHVNDGSKYDQAPHEKDVEHIMRGVKSHGGENAGLSDKGVVFKFKSKTDAEGFRSHVNKCPHRSCDAHHIDESVNEGVMQPNGTDKVDYDKGMDGNPQNPDKKNKKSKGNGDVKILNGEQEPAIKESDDAWAAAEEKRREKEKLARISDKDKNTLSKLSALMAKEKKPMKEAMYVEQSRAESGELFKSLVDRAHASSKAGNHTQAKRHLANAQTARYGITSGNMSKHKASFDKYKELKNSYTNSDDHVREDISIDEAHKINDKVEIIKGSAKGTKGRIGEIRHGAYKGAPKTYTVYHGENGATQVSKEHIRKLKEQEAVMPSYTKEETLDEISKDTLRSYANKAFAQGNDLHYDLAHSKGDKATDAERAAMKAKLSKRNDGVIKASQKLNREAVDTVKRDASGKLIAWSHEGDWEKSSTKNLAGKAANSAGKAIQTTKKLTKEEKDEGEYGYEGDMAISQLKTIIRHSEHLMGMLKPDTDLPEWVQSKITLATDYMQTAHDYMMSEMNESLDEEQLDELIRLQKATHTSNPFGAQHKDAENPNDRIRLARDAKDNRAYNRRGHSPEGSNYDPKRRGAASVKTVHNDVKANRSTDYISKKLARPADKNKSWNEEVDLEEKAAAGDWHVHDSKSGKIHSTYDSHRKAMNAMKKLNGQHDGYETPGGIIQSKYAASAASYHKEDVDLEEAAWGRDKMASLRQAHDRHMEKALAANKAGDDVAVKTHQRKMQMIQGKMQKLKQNEEVELGEECEILSELSKNTLGRYVKRASRDQSHKTALAQAYSQHDLGKTIDMDRIANRRKKGIDKAVDKLTKEEIEDFMQTEEYDQLDEISKDTLKSYVGKASQNARIQGMMQMDYAHRSKKAKSSGMKNAWDKMSKDAMKTGWKREDGIKTAVNKLTKEEAEQIDELSKDTLKSYVAKAEPQADKLSDKYSTQRMKRDKTHGQFSNDTPELEKLGRKAAKRDDGVFLAKKKLTKEDNMLTYSEFMAQLLEGRADDLKDKLAADREARLNNYDYSHEKAAKKSPVQKVKGHSYGAGEEEGEDDEGSTKTVKPASEKRGRGRPAGSKSGARV